ncbi:Hypothetical protein Minf_2382 [Methylacidiphilum infernorum V4]|uniref:Uncharacterized protein n=1 Tax=Methylacidiphilum infernorum (isolate V4) TaxID=481448 RepID=B3E0V9_METI4|nr:Hypothetical protein Minf_2382 [Methylacidiphilum infernorum V4]
MPVFPGISRRAVHRRQGQGRWPYSSLEIRAKNMKTLLIFCDGFVATEKERNKAKKRAF